MARTLKVKELNHTRLACNYGGWIYCEGCGENIGYLCYVTYDSFQLSYECKCGCHGSAHLAFVDEIPQTISDLKLTTIKNRLCCAEDQSPLFTILSKKLESYQYEVVCTWGSNNIERFWVEVK